MRASGTLMVPRCTLPGSVKPPTSACCPASTLKMVVLPLRGNPTIPTFIRQPSAVSHRQCSLRSKQPRASSDWSDQHLLLRKSPRIPVYLKSQDMCPLPPLQFLEVAHRKILRKLTAES